jgi:hypothetical protein
VLKRVGEGIIQGGAALRLTFRQCLYR